MAKVRAAILYQLNTPLQIREIDLPEKLQEGQLLVRLAASGLCHTQLLEIQGKRGADPFLPRTLGHEGAGIVEEVGPGVTKVRTGDHVVLSWIKGKGINAYPPNYQLNGEKLNAGSLTTFLERTVVSENRVIPIKKEMGLDKAALLGCAIPTGVGVSFNTAELSKESTIAVFGAGGGIGLNVVQGARLREAAMIVAIDIDDQKLEMAKGFGATHLINAKRENPLEQIMDLTHKEGVDVAVEAVGNQETMEQTYESIHRTKGLAILIGNLPHKTKICIDPFELILGKRIVGSWGGETKTDTDIPQYVDYYLNGKLKVDELIAQRFNLTQINEAFSALDKGAAGRILIEFN